MSDHSADRAAARTPGAKRAGPGEYICNLATINHILGDPDFHRERLLASKASG